MVAGLEDPLCPDLRRIAWSITGSGMSGEPAAETLRTTRELLFFKSVRTLTEVRGEPS